MGNQQKLRYVTINDGTGEKRYRVEIDGKLVVTTAQSPQLQTASQQPVPRSVGWIALTLILLSVLSVIVFQSMAAKDKTGREQEATLAVAKQTNTNVILDIPAITKMSLAEVETSYGPSQYHYEVKPYVMSNFPQGGTSRNYAKPILMDVYFEADDKVWGVMAYYEQSDVTTENYHDWLPRFGFTMVASPDERNTGLWRWKALDGVRIDAMKFSNEQKFTQLNFWRTH